MTAATIEIVKALRELTTAELADVMEGVDDICMEGARLDEGGANENRYRAAALAASHASMNLRNIQ